MSNTAARQKIADEFGESERRIDQYRPFLRRNEDLRKQISGWFINDPPDESCSFDGRIYQITASARQTRRIIADMEKLFGVVGQKEFLKICSVPFKEIDALSIDTSDIVSEDRRGPRTIGAILLHAAEPAPGRKKAAAVVEQ